MKKAQEGKPVAASAAAKSKKPYRAPRLREYGSLARLTAGGGSIGGDLSGQMGV